jgi:hypothetical protein
VVYKLIFVLLIPFLVMGEIWSLQVEPERIISIIEKRLTHAPPDIRASFPPVLRQGRVLSATISQPEYFMVAFFTAEQEERFGAYIATRTNPFVGLITTGPERAACRIEKATCAAARSCVVTNLFGFSLGPDSTILIEDHHQIIETADTGTISYTLPLAYVVSYGDQIYNATAYEYFDGLVAYSMNIWKESIYPITSPGDSKTFLSLSQLPGIMN